MKFGFGRGSGETFEWELVRAHRGPVPVILSGGLRPDNVREAIAVVQPFAVDVASGVERSPGHKDRDKLEAFAAAVAASGFRDDKETFAPSRASARATANPRPRLAPETMAILFVSPRFMRNIRLYEN